MKNNWIGKCVLITGVCGTVGRELLRQVVEKQPEEVIGIDNNESEIFFLGEKYNSNSRVRLYIGDMRDRDKLMRKMHGVDIVLHSAALKHVILCERSPRDAVQTNILGIQNIIDAATTNGVERVIFASSDKAVNPTNVMGTSKLMGERLITAANSLRRGGGPVYASTRFGNVLGSRGSVIPLFRRQIVAGGPVTLTDSAMTRFIMTLEEAVKLVLETVFLAKGGEVFVTKMHVVRIEDLAEIMIEEMAARCGHDPKRIEVKIIGLKSGEKLYEELMNEEETRRTIEFNNYFVILPAFKSVYENIEYTCEGTKEGTGIGRPYNSAVETAMDREMLRTYLNLHQLLKED